MKAFWGLGRIIAFSFLAGFIFVFMQASVYAAASVMLAWLPSTDPNVTGYNIYYGGASGVYTNKIQAGNSTNATVNGLIPGGAYYFAATAYDSSGVESPFSNEAFYSVPLNAGSGNSAPTLNAISSLILNENAGLQTIGLSGITSGATNEIQTLTITARSDNPGLVPDPTITYTSPNATGSLAFTPVSNASGTAVVTVTVNDGGATNNLVTRTFTVTVNPVAGVTNTPVISAITNVPPTLKPVVSVTVIENSGLRTVKLSGISSGSRNENQTLTVSAVSSNPGLIPNPAINYTSPNITGILTFTPAPNAYGTANITVTVNDGQAQNNLVSRTFMVTVKPKNIPPSLNALRSLTIFESAGLQTVNLSGIGSGARNEIQPVTVSVTSSDTALIPTPVLNYTNGSSTGSLTFTPVPNAFGKAVITVTVNDGQPFNNIRTRSFIVTVKAVNTPPTLDPIADVYLTQNAGIQTVNLTGISSGASDEIQTLKITAMSSNTRLLPPPAIAYASPAPAGTLTFHPATNAVGTATITVTVNDGGTGTNFIKRTFAVTVLAPATNSAAVATASSMTSIAPTAAILAPAPHNPGEFALTLSGAPNQQYIIEASANMVDWVPVQTNAAPFTFVDTQAGQFKQRFYRSVSVAVPAQ